MTLSKKQRKELYKQAIENITNDIGDKYLCGQLSKLAETLKFINWIKIDEVATIFPEFGLFKPTSDERDTYSLMACWFQHIIFVEPQFERLVCLDFCLLLLEDAEK